MKAREVLEQDILSLQETAERLNIPVDVLRKWIAWRFRAIPCHMSGNGKGASVCFFKEEIDLWFEDNGGRFLSKQVMVRKNNRSRGRD